MRNCPVCGLDQNADDVAFQHHVNGHFEEGPIDDGFEKYIPGPSSPKKRRLSEMKEQEVETLDDDICPLCSFPFYAGVSAVERESHVNSCMDASAAESTKDNSMSFSITSTPSRTFSTGQSKDLLAIATRPASFSPITFGSSGGGTRSPTYILSDQLIQQSLLSDQGVGLEDWDGPARPGGYSEWRKRNKVERGDGWWDPIKGKIGDLPDNFTPGLSPVLQDLLETSIHKGITKRAIIGREAVSITGVFRFDSTWGCGYRNALMSLSSLILHSSSLSALFSRSSNGSEPCIRRLQGWLDEAWSKGYDPPGRDHFGGKVLGGRKWIGTGDLYALFSYKGVPCDLYDFPKPKTARDRPASKALTEWVRQYFDEGLPHSQTSRASTSSSGPSGSSNASDLLMRENEGTRGSAVRRADKYPLILQHNGHSRTVVGYEENSRGDTNLLMFDPGKQVPSSLREAAIRHTTTQRRSTSTSTPSVNKKESHEAIPFSVPYTNGASEMTQWCDTPRVSSPVPQLDSRLDGGALIGSDEEINDGGWVKKKLKKLKRGDEGSGSESKKVKMSGEGGKGLGYFRVNLSTLGRHDEYQILAFTGDEPLTMAERGKRKNLTSTIIN